MAWCIWLSAMKLPKKKKKGSFIEKWKKHQQTIKHLLCELCSHVGEFCRVAHTRASLHAGSTASSPPSLPRWRLWTHPVAASRKRNRMMRCCHSRVSLSAIVQNGVLPGATASSWLTRQHLNETAGQLTKTRHFVRGAVANGRSLHSSPSRERLADPCKRALVCALNERCLGRSDLYQTAASHRCGLLPEPLWIPLILAV